jgi:hypothetical protein
MSPLQFNQTKSLLGRPGNKTTWATTLLEHTDVLQAYEAGMQEELEDPPPNQPDQQKAKKTPIPTNPPKTTPDIQNKGKEKMPPIARQTQDPLK